MIKKLTNNLLLKIISVIAAILLWIIVINIDNPTDTFTINDIPIQVLNEQSAITDNGLTYEIVGSQTVSVEVTARRTDRRKISAADFEATVDLNEIYGATSSVAVNISVVSNRSLIREWSQITRSVEVDVEALETREFEIQVIQKGTPEESYTVSAQSVSPGKVRVTAPESVMADIDHAGVEVDVEGASDDIQASGEILLYSRSGQELDLTDDRIVMSAAEADVSLSMVKTNQVSVDVVVTGQDHVAEGYQYIAYQCEPQTISVIGAKSLIAEFDKLTIQEDLTGASGNITRTYSVEELLPDGLEPADEASASIKVTYQIERLAERSFRIAGSDVELLGAQDDLEYRIGDDNVLNVVLEGLSEDLERVGSGEISVSIDVSGIDGPGTYVRTPLVSLPEEYQSFFEVSVPDVRVIVTSEEEEESSEPSGEVPSSSETEESSEEPDTAEESGQ